MKQTQDRVITATQELNMLQTKLFKEDSATTKFDFRNMKFRINTRDRDDINH